jgi:hypothetical protein
MRNFKIILLCLAGVFLCMHNFVPHSHAEIAAAKSTHHHAQDDHHHQHEDRGSTEDGPLEVPSHQESVAKYIIKHHSEQTHVPPELLYDIPGVHSLNQTDPITLSYFPSQGNYRFNWTYYSVSSSYLRGPPAVILS